MSTVVTPVRWLSTSHISGGITVAKGEKLSSCLGDLARMLVRMGYARKTLICLQDTPYYHLIARCVRRAWLCGFDEYSRRDYSHRKAWVLDRLRYLADSFAIDLCAFAIMSNHYHLVVHVDRARAASWTREEVVARWARLFSIPTIIEQWQQGVGGDAVRESAEERIEECRHRLFDISCFMACLNEHVARRANAEDECTGRFWEGRFKSQALLDDPALITAMAYVDLNPVRAGIATTPENSKFTSIHQRIAQMAAELARPQQPAADADLPLCDFQGHAVSCARTTPFRLTDYLQLLDWTRRAIGSETRAIDTRAPPILAHLRIDLAAWIAAMRPKGSVFGRALGRLDRLRLHARALGQLWIRGMRECERLYGAT